MTSEYGISFDQTVQEWARLEGEHDRMHPDRSDCGGVGSCPMMRAARDLESDMIDRLNEWRRKPVRATGHRHDASCRLNGIGELLCGMVQS